MNLNDTLKMRQSCRSFKEDLLDIKTVTEIVSAASAAPVGMRRFEELKITVVCNKELINLVEKAAKEKFKDSPYAAYYSAYQSHCIIIVAGKKREEPYQSMLQASAGCMIENMILVATERGLGSVFVSGITKAIEGNEELCEKLKIPQDFKPLAALVIGWPKVKLEERELVFDRFQVDLIE